MRAGRALVVSVLLGCAVSLGACTSVRNGLGPKDAVCFSSLPAARRAVGAAAHFAGVRYLSTVALVAAMDRTERQHVEPPAAVRALPRHGTCLVAYRAPFRAGLADRSWEPVPGPHPFAVVVVRQSNHKVLAVVLLAHAPLAFAQLS
ncbi:MAG TPA: hypothetical protein VFN50_12900 [Acidimicrobiales bacterium]|nr:hypothetical protein [Acidimicrobiales bacterium]